MNKIKNQKSKIKNTNQNFNFFNFVLSFCILVFAFWINMPISFSQHEGHQMPVQTKQEPKSKPKKSLVKEVYYCPMHPTYISDKPGDCPICNMKLVKKEDEPLTEEQIKEDTENMVQEDKGFYINSQKQQLIGVKTDKVIYRPFNKIIRTVGRVAFDPGLYQAQQEYIEALKTLGSIKYSGQEDVVKRAQALVEAAKLKLKLQGLDASQIEELEKNKVNDESLLIASADSKFGWVYATIYEYELEWIKIGQEANISAISFPGQEFKGTVIAIDPVFDAMTRSVKARIKVDNSEGKLKPDMYVDVQINADLGAQLAVLNETILDSGVRKIVFLVKDAGYFKPAEIKAGFSNDEYTQVLEGLKEGDTVVTSGNFLIDSESKLKAALEGSGHQHGQ